MFLLAANDRTTRIRGLELFASEPRTNHSERSRAESETALRVSVLEDIELFGGIREIGRRDDR